MRDRHGLRDSRDNGGAVGGRWRRGAMLLEVIVALGLLAFGLTVVGLQINSGLKIAQSNRLYTMATMLVDSKLDEVESGILQPDLIEREVKGDFGILYPGYTWRIEINPTEIEGFYAATIEIGYRESAVQEQIDDPKAEIDIEDPGTKILRTAYRLFPKPADINLERDFGITQDDIDEMMADLSGAGGGDGSGGGGAGGGGGIAGGGGPGGGGIANGPGGPGGPGDGGPGGPGGGGPGGPGGGGPIGPGGGGQGGRGFFRGGGPPGSGGGASGWGGGGGGGELPTGLPPGMNREDLLALLQSLLEMSQSGSFDPRMLQQLPEEQFMALAEILENLGMGRGNISNLKDMYRPPAGGRPGLSRVGEARRGFGRAGGRGGQPGVEGGPQGDRAQGGPRPGGGRGQPGGSNIDGGSGGNRPPNAGNRPPSQGGQQRPPGGRGRDGTSPGGGSRGNSGRTPPMPRDPTQPYPSAGH